MTLAEQLNAFLFTLLAGLLSGLAYDFYRVLRQVLRLKKTGTFVGDLLFWLFLMVAVFGILLAGNDGEVRFYVFLGLALGAGIHLIFFSQAARRMIMRVLFFLSRMTQMIIAGMLALWRIIIFPFRVLIFVITWPVLQVRHALQLAGSGIGRASGKFFGPRVRRFTSGAFTWWRRFTGRWRPPRDGQ